MPKIDCSGKNPSKSPLSRNQSSNYLFPKSPDSLPQSKTFSSNNESYELSFENNASFHPTINTKSRQIDRHRSKSPLNKSFNRFERLYMNMDQQQAKLAAMKSLIDKENLLKDIEICTFKPSINKPNKIESASHVNRNFEERNHNWMKYKENKINQLK